MIMNVNTHIQNTMLHIYKAHGQYRSIFGNKLAPESFTFVALCDHHIY